MYSLSSLPVIASLAAVAALPFSLSVGGTLLLAAGLGWIFHADYGQRHKPLRSLRLEEAANFATFPSSSRSEQHPFAA